MADPGGVILDRLFSVILSHRGHDPEESYVAQQFKSGTSRIAQKVGEEAIETVLAALSNDKNELISESADLLYHLMVLWAEQDITPDDVFEELASRAGASGIEEKNSRDSD